MSLDTHAAVTALRDAAGADRGELYWALWIQAAALSGAQIAIAGFVVHQLRP